MSAGVKVIAPAPRYSRGANQWPGATSRSVISTLTGAAAAVSAAVESGFTKGGALARSTCFVVMGYGKKADYEQAKTFDLDKSYQYIIRPGAETAGYQCIRSDEIQHAGNINVPMYEQLLRADLVIADLSTANPNAFFELGVRYALKPRTTIVISEKGLRIPFDMGQVVIRQYEHLGAGIDYAEVERMKGLLVEAINEVVKTAVADSPVYTFLTKLRPPEIEEIAAAEAAAEENATRQAISATANADEKSALSMPMATLMQAARVAQHAGEFKRAREILRAVMAVQGENVDHFVAEQLALATYKSEDLEPRAALLEAKGVLQPFVPETSADPEMLEIWGTIHQRLFELDAESDPARSDALEIAVSTFERAFAMSSDYRCGINLAFLLNCRAARTAGDEAIADQVQARRLRVRVLAICDAVLAEGIKGENEHTRAAQEYAARAIRAEALCGLQRSAEAHAAFLEAKNLDPSPDPAAVEATGRRFEALHALLAGRAS